MAFRSSVNPLSFVALLALVGCAKASTPSGPAATAPSGSAPTPDVAVAAAALPAPSTPAALAWLGKPDFGAPGPVRVEGYSRVVTTGMNDPAYAAGFSADGEYLGYCVEIGARDPANTSCALQPRSGPTLALSSDVKDDFDPAAKRALDAWVKEHGLPILKGKAPELTGSWAFARDLTVVLDAGAQSKRGAAIRLGGRVGAEKPVYPLVFDLAPAGPDLPFHTAWVNALVLSPDAKELGLVAGFFCMEWCDAFESHRIPVARFASQVLNDTGMRHHGAKDYAGSAALFEKAVLADPTHALAVYNLACAYARLQHPHARDALVAAIGAGGTKVKERAAKDADFEPVRNQPWFASLVAP